MSFFLIDIKYLEYLQNEVDRMNLESKMRSIIRELIEPMIEKSKVDREMIIVLEKNKSRPKLSKLLLSNRNNCLKKVKK